MSAPTILSRTQAATDNTLEYSLAPDAAVILMADGSARILDMGDRFYSVPPVTALLLQETLANGPAAAVQKVAAEYDVAASQVEADLERFLATLVERGVLWRSEAGGEPKQASSLTTRLTARMLSRSLAWMPSLKAKAAALLTAAKLSLAVSGWTRTIAAWRQRFPVRRITMAPAEAGELARAIDEAVCAAAAWNPLGVACKERGMACWALARSLGLPAKLVIGIELYPLSGHCWCEAGQRIVSDHAENCAAYFPALRYA